MKLKFLAATAAAAALITGAGAAQAQTLPPGVTLPGGTATTVTLPDGTRVTTTITGATTLTIETTGGPNPPIRVNITNFTISGSAINYVGTVVVGGASSAFNCTVNTATGAISGSQYCSTAFGGGSGGSTPPATTPPVTTPPTTGGGTVVTTPGPNGTTIITITAPDGTKIQVTAPQLSLIRNVEAEQFLLNLAAERLTINNVQSFVTQRLSQLQAAGLAPGGLSLTRNKDGYIGVSAGETGVSSGIWVDAAFGSIENELIGSGVDGDTKALALGVDLTGGSYNVGAFATYTTLDLSGSDAINESDGYGFGLYGRLSASPQLNFTASAGLGKDDVYFRRTAGTLVSSGDTERDTVFGLLSVDGQVAMTESILMVPSLGVSYVKSETDAYTDSNGFPIGGVESDTTLATLGATWYLTGGGVLPFVSLAATRQLNDDIPGLDRTYGTVGAGLVMTIADGVNLVGSVQHLIGKEFEEGTTFSLTLRKGF